MAEADRPRPVTVVKVGGSLYDLPDLGPRLRAWLAELNAPAVLLVPGGGPAADWVRDLDRIHGLGADPAHWLALRALGLTGAFLAALLPGASLIDDLGAWRSAGPQERLAVLAPHRFAHEDEGRPGSLPHSWEAGSDAVAARVAVAAGADCLVLLKSVSVPGDLSWRQAARQKIVDPILPSVLERAPSLSVKAVNFRAWHPRPADGQAPGPAWQ